MSRWLLLSVALLAIGLIVRALLYFPLAAFPIDSDGVLAGLCAFRVESGHLPFFFPGGTRLSAASCYLAALFFQLVGPGRAGLALTGLTWAAAYLICSLLFLRAMLGEKIACLAYPLAVIPSQPFMTVTYIPWAYGEIVASCAATLWLAALWRNQGALWQRLCFGISVGLGLWFSMQTLMIALPAIAWIALKRRNATLGESIPAILGAIVGATPLLAGNVATGFASFTQNWASRPASSLPQIWDNFIWVLTAPLPQLLYGFSGVWSVSTVIIVGYALIACGFAVALRKPQRQYETLVDSRGIGQLLLLVFVLSILLYACSQAGSVRGWTVRYIAPLYVVVPLFAGVGAFALWRRSRWLAAIAIAAMTVPSLLLYSLPGSVAREGLTAQLQTDTRLLGVLAAHDVQLIYGDYFLVYHLNFEDRERIAGVPSVAQADYLGYGAGLPATGVRWAMVSPSREQLASWTRAVQARGTVSSVDDEYLFIAADAAPNTAKLLATLRSAPH
jgi:hypothetical protein